MSQFLNSATVAGGTLNAALAIHDEDKSDLFEPRFGYCYQMRNAKSAANFSQWIELWPSAKLASGDSTAPLALLGQDSRAEGSFEYPSSISRGMVRPWFFRGMCKDSTGSPLIATTVTGYITATDAAIGMVGCDANANYELPTVFNQPHYLVAYRSGVPDVTGATVDTLTPSL